MKDQVFSGATVEAAVAAATRSLGIASGTLRYVVLDAGQPGILGMKDRPAQIAVLVGAHAPAPAATRTPATPARPAAAAPRRRDLAGELRGMIREVARAADIDVSAEVEPEAGGLLVRIGGTGVAELSPAVVESLTHLLQKAGSREDTRVPVAVEVGGKRLGREEDLRSRARKMADEVLADGQGRETQPLNGYERRVVHMALADDARVETYSVGEGDARRVRIDRRAPGSAPELM